ncbi:MAG: DUF3048 domain-containing protein [Anaerolineaceae bacterium]
MDKIKTIAFSAALVLILSTILSACQTALTIDQVKATVAVSVNQTMTAAPSATQLPTLKPTATAAVPSATPTLQPIQVGPTNFPSNVDPLTGMTVSDPSQLNRRPVMVKVSNHPRSTRPHAGLSFADMVFSYYIGEGGTRYLALFYSQDAPKAGPIRSGRMIDRWLVSMYQGIFALESAWKPELDLIYGQLGASRIFQSGPNSCPAICDDSTQITENRLYANTAELSKKYATLSGADNSRPNLDGMAFNSVPPSGGGTGNELTMQFHTSNLEYWKFDASINKYLRWTDSEDVNYKITLVPLTDRDTGQQLAFSNVIVIWAPYETLNGDDTWHEVQLPGNSGKMLLFRNGQVYEGKWKGVNTFGPIQFFDKNNKPLELQPGNTWIAVTGESSTMQQDTPGIWKVVFYK